MLVSLFLYIFFAQSGQRDVIAHSKEAHKTDEKEADNHDEANINAQGVKSPIEQSACNACHGVNLFAEDEGHIVEQHIAHHATSRTCYTAHDDGHPKGMAQSQGFL